jgi:hypothetical protein
MNYFQIHFIEDGCILQIVVHRNRLFVNNSGKIHNKITANNKGNTLLS